MKPNMSTIGSIYGNEKGMVLAIGLIFLAILSLVGATALITTTTDLKIGANFNSSYFAFCDAEAGINYTVAMIEADLANGTFDLPTASEPSVALAYPVPAGFSFIVSPLEMTGTNNYTLTSTGRGPGNTQAAIRVTLQRKSGPVINYAAFGDQSLDTKNSGRTLSYDSSSPDPSENDPSDPSFVSTHLADVASNEWLVTHNKAEIDGKAVFGEQSDGSATVNRIHSGTVFYETTAVNAGRIDPDPLGVNSGGVYDPSSYSADNDNTLFGLGATINTRGTVKLTGKLEGANYYFTAITLKNGAILEIDTEPGPVNIFLDGGLEAKNGSNINVTGNPTDVSIFSKSSNTIVFKHDSTFKGFVYAPFANVDMKNSSGVYGAIWSRNVVIKNSGMLYYDAALRNKYRVELDDLTLLSWKEVLN